METILPEPTHPQLPPRCRVDVLIRYKDSEASLPHVLSCLKKQTYQAIRIVGVDTGCKDGSTELLRDAGAEIKVWEQSYSHPKVLNFGIRHCTSELVLLLSSHTALLSPDTIEKMVIAMDDPSVACVSGKWDSDPYFGDAVDWSILQQKGLKFGSIYSNSMGMIRRTCWEDFPFDETLKGSEDYAWAVEQLRRGHVCRRFEFPFDYQRSRSDRVFEMSLEAFQLAKSHGLKLVWLGPRHSALALAAALLTGKNQEAAVHWGKLRAWLKSR